MEAFGETARVARGGVLHALSAVFRRTDMRSAVVLGESGVGKTSLIRPLLGELSGGLHAVRVGGTPGLSDVPYGAAEQGIDGFPAGRGTDPEVAMRALRSSLERVGGPAGALLVVDNAELLDEHTALLVSQLIASRTQRVLLLGLPSVTLPAELKRLVREGQLESFTLERLGTAEVHAVCEQVLDGPVLRSTGAYYSVLSAGLPIMLLALLSLGKRQGTLARRHGIWVQAAPLEDPDARFVDLVRGRLSGLSATDMRVLNLVALGEPLGLTELLRLTEQPAVDKLCSLRLIRISNDFTVTSVNPMYAGVLRNRVPVGHGRGLRAHLEQAQGARPLSGQASVRYVSWAMSMGERSAGPQLLAAAQAANHAFAPGAAFQFAGLVSEPALAAAASVQMARADFHLGRQAAARARLHGIMERETDPGVLESAAMLQAAMCLQSGGTVGRLVAIALRWQRAIRRSAGPGSLPERSGWQVLYWTTAACAGRLEQAEAGLRGMLEPESGGRAAHTPTIRAVAAAVLSAITGASGHLPAALHASAEALDILREVPDLPADVAGFVLVRRLDALVGAGHWGDVELEVQGLLERAPHTAIHLGGAIALAEGQCCLGRGLHRRAFAKLSEAVAALEANDFWGLLPQATAAAAFAAALLGDSDAATRNIAAYSGLAPPLSRAARALGQAHVLAARALLGDRDSHPRLQSLAAACQETGLVGTALHIHMISLASGGQPQVKQLGECLRSGDWPNAEILHAYVRGLSDQSASALLRVGEDARDAGLTGVSRQAWLAAGKAGSSGAPTLRKKIIGALETLDAEDAPPAANAEVAAASIENLTPRETSVARLAASRRSNAEIASLLSLSVRTVEGHIYRIFDKLGVRRREELVPLLFPRPD